MTRTKVSGNSFSFSPTLYKTLILHRYDFRGTLHAMAVSFGFKAKSLIEEEWTTQDHVDDLRAWLMSQNFPKLTNEQLVQFLVACNNDHEACKKSLKAYYSAKLQLKTLFINRDVLRADLQQQLKTV